MGVAAIKAAHNRRRRRRLCDCLKTGTGQEVKLWLLAFLLVHRGDVCQLCLECRAFAHSHLHVAQGQLLLPCDLLKVVVLHLHAPHTIAPRVFDVYIAKRCTDELRLAREDMPP